MAPPRSDFKLETYERLSTVTKTRFCFIKKTVESFLSKNESLTNVELKMLNTYLGEVRRKFEDYESNFQRVLSLTTDETFDIDKLMTDQNEISELYIYISCNIEAILKIEEPSVVSNNSVDNVSLQTNQSQVRLPKIDLPKFTGDLSTWTSFINLFDSTIHNNSTLNDVMRFQYLLSSLENEPLSLIRSLSITPQNYTIAYNLLRDRYHNNRRLQLLHLNKLLDLPQISASHIHDIRSFVNVFNENTQALSALDCEVADSNAVMVAVLLRKMDVDLKRKLEEFRSNSLSSKHTLPTVNEILEFLTTECTHLEDATLSHCVQSTETVSALFQNKPFVSHKPFPHKKVNMLATQVTPQSNTHENKFTPCFACNQTSHKIYLCSDFKNMSPQQRFQLVKKSQRCVSCLGAHDTKTCKSQTNCKMCHKRHHTLLHFNVDSTMSVSTSVNHPNTQALKTSNSSSNKPEPSVTLISQNNTGFSTDNTTVLLGTLLVHLCSADGKSHVFRALLDSGSMCNLITEHAANILNIKRHKSHIQLSGIDHHVTKNKGQIFVDFKNLSGKVIATNQPTLILDRLTVDLPRVPLSEEVLRLTRSFTLADPTFHVPSRIDVVIGGSLFPHIFTQEQISLGHNMPHMLGTHFGYVVMGSAPCIPTSSNNDDCVSSTSSISLHAVSDFDLHNSLQQFWIQEEPPKASMKTQEEDMCDKHFADTHSRNPDGRYVLRLPVKESHPHLGDSRRAAETRLFAMERKFERNKHFSELYHSFMTEYIELEHMSRIDFCKEDTSHCFLPHHGILKESSSTTKLRTVFDASCKTDSDISLNDILMTGRKLQTNISDLILHFRRYNVVFCCDIKQMYRQILIHPDDRNLQLILWRDHPSEPISTFQLNTVTYGMNSSPYLAMRTLHQLAEDHGDEFPEAAHVLKYHTYVDDVISGADSESEALILQSQLISLLNHGCFELRKWVSNSPKLLCHLPDNYLETPKFLGHSQTPQFTVLGLQWSPVTDTFSYSFQMQDTSKELSKRTVLSCISQIYDPCGFLVPFIMLAKCFIQLIWTKGLPWDLPLPLDLQTQWKSFTDDLKFLSNISIPRSLNLSIACKIELHGFCDASEAGYAAAVYLKCENPNLETSVNLMISKSRVAPLKRVTIPRLELCAAHLLAQLVSHIKSMFPDIFTSHNIYLWSDSSITLTWLQTPPYRLKTYVANRVAQTQELVPTECWRHISSEENPTDCASRGVLISYLIDHKLWWNGPSWLSLPSCNWPTPKFTPVSLDPNLELKPNHITVLTTNTVQEWPLLSQFSSWTTLLRVMALILRFIHNCRSADHRSGFLTTEELRCARLKIFWCVQQTAFVEDISLLRQQKDCNNRLARLNPFIDDKGLIRVGGRLKFTLLSYDAKHPILLPKCHHVTQILIDYFHVHHLHAGAPLIQWLLSQEVWILSARSVIRIHKCLISFKHQRTKWNIHRYKLKIEDLVLFHTPSPPLDWPLGRITAVHPGADGVVRVAQVKTATGIITQPAVKLFPLPIC